MQVINHCILYTRWSRHPVSALITVFYIRDSIQKSTRNNLAMWQSVIGLQASFSQLRPLMVAVRLLPFARSFLAHSPPAH